MIEVSGLGQHLTLFDYIRDVQRGYQATHVIRVLGNALSSVMLKERLVAFLEQESERVDH